MASMHTTKFRSGLLCGTIAAAMLLTACGGEVPRSSITWTRDINQAAADLQGAARPAAAPRVAAAAPAAAAPKPAPATPLIDVAAPASDTTTGDVATTAPTPLAKGAQVRFPGPARNVLGNDINYLVGPASDGARVKVRTNVPDASRRAAEGAVNFVHGRLCTSGKITLQTATETTFKDPFVKIWEFSGTCA